MDGHVNLLHSTLFLPHLNPLPGGERKKRGERNPPLPIGEKDRARGNQIEAFAFISFT